VSVSGGKIICEQAYAQGKMLNSASWNGDLARGITPSDIDFIVESNGACLLAEFTRDATDIDGLSIGQSIMYRRLASRPGQDVVCVCRHCVPWEQQIDTRHDVQEATAYFSSGSKNVRLTNCRWQQLVCTFTSNATAANAMLAKWHDDDEFLKSVGL
jgi:hypothetical protein